ncbi:MAG: hypothetical protein FJ403_12175 [Verrucomicrobia bacterium]|nr:hypothetical protein [Verrucomicrobiota bacterium]
MSNWTSSALQTLESYLRRNRGLVGASGGADPDEVAADLRRHVEEEIAALQLPVVTEKDVRRIVSQIGPVPEEEVPMPVEPERKRDLAIASSLASGSLLLFGVILPVLTVSFELFTRLCSSLLFDPIPSPLHLVLAVLAPLANFLAWQSARSPGNKAPRWLWLANGAACGVTLFYTVLFGRLFCRYRDRLLWVWSSAALPIADVFLHDAFANVVETAAACP